MQHASAMRQLHAFPGPRAPAASSSACLAPPQSAAEKSRRHPPAAAALPPAPPPAAAALPLPRRRLAAVAAAPLPALLLFCALQSWTTCARWSVGAAAGSRVERTDFEGAQLSAEAPGEQVALVRHDALPRVLPTSSEAGLVAFPAPPHASCYFSHTEPAPSAPLAGRVILDALLEMLPTFPLRQGPRPPSPHPHTQQPPQRTTRWAGDTQCTATGAPRG